MVVTVVGIAVIPFLKYIVNTEQEIPRLAVYYLFSLANVVISYLFVYKSTILTADQKNYKVVNISIWTSLLKTILQIFPFYCCRIIFCTWQSEWQCSFSIISWHPGRHRNSIRLSKWSGRSPKRKRRRFSRICILYFVQDQFHDLYSHG